jgi:hypothetical protein
MNDMPAHAQPEAESYRTDCEPIDWAEYERWARLSPGARVQTAINAHRLVFGLLRGRLRRQHPDLSDTEITRKLWAELERGY